MMAIYVKMLNVEVECYVFSGDGRAQISICLPAAAFVSKFLACVFICQLFDIFFWKIVSKLDKHVGILNVIFFAEDWQ